MKHDITIKLSLDEALILSHMLGRFAQTDRLSLANNAEFVALSAIAAQLDRALVEPFMADSVDILTAARDRLAGEYEDLAPGVEADSED